MSSMSIGRIYVRPSANIAVSDYPYKGPQKIILMDRFWGFSINVLLQGEGFLYPLYRTLGIAGNECSMPY